MVLRISFATALVFALSSLTSHAVAAVTIAVQPEKSAVEFLAIGRPSALKIKGEGAKPEGRFQIESGTLKGELKADLDQFETGIKLRDRHMKEKYLETAKEGNKSAVFKLTEAKIPDGFLDKGNKAENLPFKGNLKLHGIEREVSGIYSAGLQSEKSTVSGEAQFKIKLTDFGVAIPSFSGITVAEDVEVKVRFNGALEKQAK